MSNWLGIAKKDREIITVNITDNGLNMPYGNTDWLEAIDGTSTAIAVVALGENDPKDHEVIDCSRDAETQNFYYTYE